MTRTGPEGYADCVATELPRARRAAYLMCGDWADAEDLAQQAMVRLYGAWERLERDGSLRPWVATTLTRLWLDELRRRRRKPVLLLAEVPERTDGSGGGAGAVDDDREHLLAVLATLSPRQRACLVLRFWEDLSVHDTARALGCSEGTVKSLTHHGVRAMRERMGTTELQGERP